MYKQSIKNYVSVTALAIVITSMIGCSKSSVTPTATNKFTLRGNTYSVNLSIDVPISKSGSSTNDSNELSFLGLATNKTTSGIIFLFNGTARPAAGSYSVVDIAATLGVNQVAIQALDSISVSQQALLSAAGTDNVKLTLTVNSAGKITINLPITQLTGVNVDNTDPSNSKLTPLSTTLSGSFSEQ